MQHEDAPIDVERLLPGAIRAILESRDETSFLHWIRCNIHHYLTDQTPIQDDLFSARESVSTELLQSFAVLFGRALWNVTPLPANDFLPRPLPAPGRNAPCPCGSGLKFKRCCQPAYQELPPLKTDDIWPILLEVADEQTRQQAVRSGRIPAEALAMLAQDYLAENRPKKGLKLLEPLFEGKPAGTGQAHDFAMNTLCDIYDRLGYSNKKSRLLHRIIDTVKKSPLRSGAWQRMAAIRMDEGDNAGAWQAMESARRDAPGEPYTGILEIQLLLAEGRTKEARERARFWHRMVKKQGGTPDMVEFFESVSNDPHQALLEITSASGGDIDQRLQTWLEQNRLRPLPAYTIQCHAEEGGARPLGILIPPAELIPLEESWHQHFPLEKPFSIGEVELIATDPWNPALAGRWVDWLERHPRAFDSIDLLDDLAGALLAHPLGVSPWNASKLLLPVLTRSLAILRHAVESATDSTRLPWLALENRPALRNLIRLIHLEEQWGNPEQMLKQANLLLELNPDDNHGVRGLIMQQLLRKGDERSALALACGSLPRWHPSRTALWKSAGAVPSGKYRSGR